MDCHYDALGITERQFWDAMMEWFPQNYVGFPDAAEVLPALHQKGFRLFTATTNSALICRTKLTIGGLGGFNGSPYFV